MGKSEFYDGEESSEDEAVDGGGEMARPSVWVDDEVEDIFVLEVDDYGDPVNNENLSLNENGQDVESVVSGSQDESDSSGNDYKRWPARFRNALNAEIENPTITEEWFSGPYVPEFVEPFTSVDDMCDPTKDWLRPVVVEGWDDTKEKDWLEYLKKKASSPVKKPKDETQMSDEEFNVHLNVLDALYLIKTTSLARQGLKKLHNLLTENDINLNYYFDDLDFPIIRYITWGLNFYYMCEGESAVLERLCGNKTLTYLEWTLMDAASLIICEPYTDIINPKYWALFLKWYAKKYLKSKLRLISKKPLALRQEPGNINSEIASI